ncbi:hypothetical protein RRG08_067054 [Elysia crispata]|uniref:Uncharacterized protein n=1 Tax=Elysia crispata TaxID=231223 RepID=A0AAE1B958_9GAST|nr:hypothetical protein RRG08_067054 [Elysia crispata]
MFFNLSPNLSNKKPGRDALEGAEETLPASLRLQFCLLHASLRAREIKRERKSGSQQVEGRRGNTPVSNRQIYWTVVLGTRYTVYRWVRANTSGHRTDSSIDLLLTCELGGFQKALFFCLLKTIHGILVFHLELSSTKHKIKTKEHQLR